MSMSWTFLKGWRGPPLTTMGLTSRVIKVPLAPSMVVLSSSKSFQACSGSSAMTRVRCQNPGSMVVGMGSWSPKPMVDGSRHWGGAARYPSASYWAVAIFILPSSFLCFGESGVSFPALGI